MARSCPELEGTEGGRTSNSCGLEVAPQCAAFISSMTDEMLEKLQMGFQVCTVSSSLPDCMPIALSTGGLLAESMFATGLRWKARRRSIQTIRHLCIDRLRDHCGLGSRLRFACYHRDAHASNGRDGGD